jgi:hypothetical protein
MFVMGRSLLSHDEPERESGFSYKMSLKDRFAGFFGLGIGFVPDSQGAVAHLLEMYVFGNYRFQCEEYRIF